MFDMGAESFLGSAPACFRAAALLHLSGQSLRDHFSSTSVYRHFPGPSSLMSQSWPV